jgi:hypothetical protein
MHEIRSPQHIVDRIERRWAAKLEQMTACPHRAQIKPVARSRPSNDGR